ncbi:MULTISPECIES: hypothetical protein [unclassified Agrococcus]|uniref:hypothetical protein n=1 Tax=unclassified Agrococcus TaxID=2615065 RepID=UPI003608FD0D
MSYYAVEWVVFHPLTKKNLARIILRTIDGVDYYVAVRDAGGERVVLGSWDALGTAENSVVAMYHQETGESIYGDPEADRYLRVHGQTPLPGARIVRDETAGASRQAAMPPLRSARP